MLKQINIRMILTVLAVFILLYSFAVYLILSDDGAHNQIATKDLLNENWQVVYGVDISDKAEKSISFRLNETGEADILFHTAAFKASDYPALQLAITALSKNYMPILVWQIRDDPSFYDMQLLQPSENAQINLLANNPNWKGEIVQLGLSFVPQEHLGLAMAANNAITIQSMLLRQYDYLSDYFVLFNYWTEYKPWTYRSINHLKTNQLLPIYAQPIIFILIWVMCSWVILLMGSKRNYFFIIALAAWLLLDLLQLNNLRSITSWTQDVYASDEKILPDEQLNKIAFQVKSLLGLENDKANKMKNNKVLVLSSNKYHRSRVIYHMLPVNSSFLDVNVEKSIATVTQGDYILSLSLNQSLIRPTAGQLRFNNLVIKVKEIAYNKNYSIMKVLQ